MNELRFSTTGANRAECRKRAEMIASSFYGEGAPRVLHEGDARISEMIEARTAGDKVAFIHPAFQVDWIVKEPQ